MSNTATIAEEKVAGKQIPVGNVFNMQDQFADVAAFNLENAAYVNGTGALKSAQGVASVRAYNEIKSEPVPGTAEFAAKCRDLDHRSLGYRLIKRAFDIVFSSLIIVVGFIPGLILSIIIAIDTKASPIYSSIRVGSKGPFKFFKFRTMVADSDNLKKYFTPEQLDQWHREHKVDNDPRVTKIGRIMRATSIDELPQFFNVWLSQISTIGPRCVTEEELGYLGKDKELYLSVPSGITGAWQIGDRNSASWENGTRQAIELDYVRKASLMTDMRIFFGTFGAMFIRRTGK